ncbi:MAG: amidase [Pseudomonadota bacterium]
MNPDRNRSIASPGVQATRRGALGLMAGGAGLLAASGAPAQDVATTGVDADTLACAQSLFSLDYTQSEREQMLAGIDAWLGRAEALRARERPNTLSPALVFDPRLPGRPYREQENRFTPAPHRASALPRDEADIAFAGLADLAAWMEAGLLSSERLTRIYLARIERHGAKLECFTAVFAERALSQARERDAERAAGQVRGPLHGLPYALKDIIDVEGLPATWGATPYRERIGEQTATAAFQLEAAGAVLLGKSTVGALAYGDIWYDGVTRNPFNTEEGSSGSSAGSASAAAAGLCAFSIGTETLGSIVSPSHRCGAAGLRPTFGRVSRAGAMALCWSLDKIGPITRYAEDAAPVLAALNGFDDADPSSLSHGLEIDLSAEVAGLRVGYDPAWFEDGAAPDLAALEAARALGVELVEISLEDHPYGALLIQLEAESAAAFEHLTLSDLDDQLRWQEAQAWPNTWRRARFASAVDLINADRLRRQVMEMMDRVFEDVDLIIGPNFAGAMLLITNYTGHPQLAFRSGFMDTPTRTIFGAPAGEDRTPHRTPYATSLWAPLFEEGRLIALGRAIEARLGAVSERPAEFE